MGVAYKLALPYIPEIQRQSYVVSSRASHCKTVLEAYIDSIHSDPVVAVGSIEDVIEACTSLLIAARAAASAAGLGQRSWV